VAFQSDNKVKCDIFTTLGSDQLFRLLSDDEVPVVMKTLGLLRNLVSAPHIDQVMSIYGKQVMQVNFYYFYYSTFLALSVYLFRI